jgi:hypothetical protein
MREVVLGPRYAIRLHQLRRWHVLTAQCAHCRHTRHMRLWEVKGNLPENTFLSEVEERLCCQRCGNRDGNRLLVMMMEK